MPVNPKIVSQQVSNLRLLHPELVNDDEAWMLAIESETDLNKILTQIVRAIDDAAALEDGTVERLGMLEARKARFAHRQKALRELAFKLMDGAGLQRMELPEATLSIRAGQQQLVGECDAKKLPDELCKISREPDRNKIKLALKDGQTVPGFNLSNSQATLSIRIK
jgi:hypothetical protein